MAKYAIGIKELKRDAFREKVFEIVDYAYLHRVWAIAGASTVVAFIALTFAYFGYQGYLVSQQAEDFYTVERILNDPQIGNAEQDKQARVALNDFLGENPGSSLTPFAWMYLAQIAWRQKDLKAAAAAFQQAKTHDLSDSLIRQLAIIGEAKIHEAEGNLAAAVKILESLPGGRFADLKGLNLGRLAAAGKNAEEAKKYFENVVKQQPPSQLAGWAGDAMAALPGTAR